MGETRVGAYGLIVRDDHVLLSHWLHGRVWTLPGGGVDHGEDPADAAVREIFEETGYVASLDGLLGIGSHVVPAANRLAGTGDLHAIQIVYRASVVSGVLTNELDGSSDEARWIGLAELHELPQVPTVARALRWAGF